MKTLGLRAFTAFLATTTALTALICTWAPWARADQVAYLINVTVRPGYNFANADAALNYGRDICEKISQGLPYERVMSDIKADFGTADEYQASYLISQSA